ncbi:MAG TPA: alpha/beta fold hydrolase [Ilumatobacteraceae bacterium]
MGMTRVRGADLAWTETGAGPWLVWGHGLTSSMASEDLFGLISWTKMAGHAHLLRYDARGHGLSESSADPNSYHWRELARDQLALADAAGIGSYIAGGASMGCATALHAAVLAPQRIRALILAIPPTAWESRAAQQDTYRLGADLVETGDIDALVAGAHASPAPDPLASFPQWRDGMEAAMRAADPVRLARIYRGAAITDFPAVTDVATVQQPTLILAWTGDPGHPMSTAERLAELIPRAELHRATTFRDLSSWTDITSDFVDRLGT